MVWYAATIVLPVLPIGVVWWIDSTLAHKAMGWSELVEKGDLLVVAVTVSAMSVATMHSAVGVRASNLTLGTVILLVIVNSVALAWVASYNVAKVLAPTTDDSLFVFPSLTLFTATVALGGLAVRLAKRPYGRSKS